MTQFDTVPSETNLYTIQSSKKGAQSIRLIEIS